jgi:hypothetical protein
LIHELSTKTILHHPSSIDIAPRVLQESVQLQQAGNELLKHFWSSLLSPTRLPNIAKALQDLNTKIMTVKDTMAPFEKHQYEGLVANLQLAIEAALGRYKKM